MTLAAYRKHLTFLFVLCVLAGCGNAAAAQETNRPAAQKFDEFGDILPTETAARELKERSDMLVKTHGISRSRVKVVNGGYRRWRHLELWLVPPGEHAPIPTPNAFPQKRVPRRK